MHIFFRRITATFLREYRTICDQTTGLKLKKWVKSGTDLTSTTSLLSNLPLFPISSQKQATTEEEIEEQKREENRRKLAEKRFRKIIKRKDELNEYAYLWNRIHWKDYTRGERRGVSLCWKKPSSPSKVSLLRTGPTVRSKLIGENKTGSMSRRV